jgi:hypothetical protein
MPGECRSLTEAVTISTPATLRRLSVPDKTGHARPVPPGARSSPIAGPARLVAAVAAHLARNVQ